MLRRRLVLHLGPLIALLLLTSLVAVLLLQHVIGRLESVNRDAGLAGNPIDHLTALSASFRWMATGLAGVFLTLIAVCAIVLLRLGRLIVRPMDQLVQAARHLSDGDLDYRVQLSADDEFGQLADAYNRLADQLSQTEKRKLETLGQVALAVNHELNNLMAIITLQVCLAGRQSPGNVALEACLQQIQSSLERMAESVRMLKNARRIVLTDYVKGLQMLDLRRSAEVRQEVNAVAG